MKKIYRYYSKKKIIIIGGYLLLIIFGLVLNIAFSTFTNRSEKSVANIKVAGMKYSMYINGTQNYIVTAPKNQVIKSNITIKSLNDLDSKYELIYNICSDETCTNFIEKPEDLTIEYSSKTIDEISGIIKSSEIKNIRIIITNKTDKIYYIKLNINAGYIHNTLALRNMIIHEYNEEDIKIAALIEGEISTTFPVIKGDYVATVICTTNNGPSNATGTVTWNGSKWVVNINGVDNGQTICNVSFVVPLKDKLLAKEGGSASIEAKTAPDFTKTSPWKRLLGFNEITDYIEGDYLTSDGGRAIGTGYVLNTETGYFSLTNYTFNNDYSDEHINQYVCDAWNEERNVHEDCLYIYQIKRITEGNVLEAYNLISSDVNYETVYDETGLYASSDDYGTSYYYRGATERLNNNLIFGGFQWKIVRINGDGSIRIIYNGTEEEFNQTGKMNARGSKTHINQTLYVWNELNENDAKYVGYMYGGANGVASTSRNGIIESAATYNQTSSNAKIQLDYWYEINISGKTFEQKIVDNLFCNDRQLRCEVGGTGCGLGYGSTSTVYAAIYRLVENKLPTLRCGQKNDRFTKNDTTIGNGALTYPIGLITADEASMAGFVFDVYNDLNYLYTQQRYWTLSPKEKVSIGSLYNYAVMFGIYSYQLGSYSVNNSAGLRPVININSNVAVTGDGSATNPYSVQ